MARVARRTGVRATTRRAHIIIRYAVGRTTYTITSNHAFEIGSDGAFVNPAHPEIANTAEYAVREFIQDNRIRIRVPQNPPEHASTELFDCVSGI